MLTDTFQLTDIGCGFILGCICGTMFGAVVMILIHHYITSANDKA